MNKKQTANQQYYEQFWQDPEAGFLHDRKADRRRIEMVISELRKYGCQNVLDVGCGSGDLVREINRNGFTAQGMDISEKALEAARKLDPVSTFTTHVADQPGWPFEANSMDCITMLEVLEHLFDLNVTLDEIYKTLKPGGLLVASVPYHGLIKNLAIVLINFEAHFDVNGAHIRFFTRRSIAEIFSRHGFKVLTNKIWLAGRLFPPATGLFFVAQKPV